MIVRPRKVIFPPYFKSFRHSYDRDKLPHRDHFNRSGAHNWLEEMISWRYDPTYWDVTEWGVGTHYKQDYSRGEWHFGLIQPNPFKQKESGYFLLKNYRKQDESRLDD